MDKLTKARLADGLIRVIAVGGVLGVALLAPNALKALDRPTQILLKKLDERERRRMIGEALSHLKYHKLITENYQHGLELTGKAQKRLLKLNVESLELIIPKKWDGRWRLVFFDIPETRRHHRSTFTEKIQSLGFRVLQQSVYIYPYACREEIAMVSECYGIAKFITYTEVTYIDNDTYLRKYFNI